LKLAKQIRRDDSTQSAGARRQGDQIKVASSQ